MPRVPLRITSLFVLVIAALVAVLVQPLRQPWGRPPSLALPDGSTMAVRSVARPTELRQAARLLADGAYEEAVRELEPHTGHHEPAVAAGAELLIGRAHLAAGDSEAARTHFNNVITGYPDSPEARLASFALAQSWASDGNVRQAIKAYQVVVRRDPDLAPYAQLEIIKLLRQTGQREAAEKEATALANEPLIRRTAVAALEDLREIQSERGDSAGFLKTTRRILELATLPVYRAQLTYEAAQAERMQGNTETAIRELQEVVVTMPDTLYASRALAALDEMGEAGVITAEQRGIVAYHAGDYGAAIGLFTSVIDEHPESDQAWYYRGMSHLRTGDIAAAAADLREVAARVPESPHAATALVTAGRLLEGLGEPDQARQVYEQAIERYGETEAGANARIRLGLMRYVTGDLNGATELWMDGGHPQVEFWLGKAREQAGDIPGARAAWQAAVQADPDGYYGFRAMDLLGTINGPASPAATTTADLRAPRDLWPVLTDWLSQLDKDPETVEHQAAGYDGFRRALMLLDLGLVEEARWEIDALVEEHPHDPALLALLAVMLADRGDPTEAAHVVHAMNVAARAHEETPPAELGQLIYPIAFADLLVSSAARHDTDPLLLAALVRQESGFNPSARSPAGALGLTQVMPETGREIARNLGVTSWEPDDLLDPAVSLEFGAAYLADRLKRFDGHLFAALAAYNTGDGPVREWLQAPGADDPDVFAERIPYAETRDYVRQVYANYLQYRRLYGEQTT